VVLLRVALPNTVGSAIVSQLGYRKKAKFCSYYSVVVDDGYRRGDGPTVGMEEKVPALEKVPEETTYLLSFFSFDWRSRMARRILFRGLR
jgi:hypothetical protein